MNIPFLSAEIVRRVQHSPDGVINLEQVVANLIREERDRDALLARDAREDHRRRLEQEYRDDFQTVILK